MNDNFEREKGLQLRFFHVCTDGTHNGRVHFEDKDYCQANIIAAICAFKSDVIVLCFCHMSNHSHFVIASETAQAALKFGETYKRDYSRYVALNHSERMVYQNVDVTPKEIGDLLYLKRCIAYVLLNPVSAGLVKRPEDYNWSSFNVYFNFKDDDSVPVGKMKVKEYQKTLKTRVNLAGSGLKIDATGNVSLKSFIDYRFVENLFKGRTEFFKALALTNIDEEENKYVRHKFIYSDTELIAEILNYSRRLYGKEFLSILTKDEKYRIITYVRKKTLVKGKRIARILRLPEKEVSAFLGDSF